MLETSIQSKINALPENIRNAIEQFDWATEILHIAQDHQLQIDTIESFRRETLLVIVGSTAAIDFEKNLVKNMEISHEVAERIVADANQHIFIPLQKIAFSHDDVEDEILAHDDISNVMGEHGIELVDEFKPEPRPKNELQDLADSLFNTGSKEIKNIADTFSEEKRETKSEIVPVQYNEPIYESDLAGIDAHRIDTGILTQKKPEDLLQFENVLNAENKTKKESSIENKLLAQSHMSKTENIDVSPTKTDLVNADGSFLKHIGAS